jgi:hypothetical protein
LDGVRFSNQTDLFMIAPNERKWRSHINILNLLLAACGCVQLRQQEASNQLAIADRPFIAFFDKGMASSTLCCAAVTESR